MADKQYRFAWTNLYLEPDDADFSYDGNEFQSIRDAERYQKAVQATERYVKRNFGLASSSIDYASPEGEPNYDTPVMFDEGLKFGKLAFKIYEGREDHDELLDDLMAFIVDSELQLDTSIPDTFELRII